MHHIFLSPHGDYHNRLAYHKAEYIYDITFYIAHTYLQNWRKENSGYQAHS